MTNAATNVKSPDCSIIALDKFIQATRDSGYKSTAAALSELVDNSIQAAATRIAITVAATTPDDDNGIEVSILDNGLGMDPYSTSPLICSRGYPKRAWFA
jgi:signal transduction histidine kinase